MKMIWCWFAHGPLHWQAERIYHKWLSSREGWVFRCLKCGRTWVEK